MTSVDLSVDLAPRNPRELRLANPVIAASGCFGFGTEYAGLIDVQRLGAFVSPGITPKPRRGNALPRTAETPAGLLSAGGLQNPGIRAFVRKYPSIWSSWRVPAIVNIAALRVEDYAMMAAVLEEQTGIAAIELDLSSPDVSPGEAGFIWDPDAAAAATGEVRAATTLPLLVKLGPGASDLIAVAQAVEEAGADALTLTNGVVGMAIDVKRRRPALANVSGRLSGPAIKPIALWMVYRVRAAVGIPIVGVGGIASLEDALEFIMAGANAVQVGTAIFAQPTLLPSLIDDLAAWMEREGVTRLDEIVGVAQRPDLGQDARDTPTGGDR